MIADTRLLPSMRALAAFEAAARTGSFSAAAAELSVTQGAVSRRIKTLEADLGTALFVRKNLGIALTAAGETYLREVAAALTQIRGATLRALPARGGGNLDLAVLPTLCSRWLIPRLPEFTALHPGITVNLSTRLRPFDFSREDFDAAILVGGPHWSGAVSELLMEEQVVPICSPEFAARHRIESAADIAKLPLMHIATRPQAWREWFAACGFEAKGTPGMHLEQFGMIAQAAKAGLGVALLPRFLMEPEIARGELVVALDAPVTSSQAYYFVYPDSRVPVQVFRDWLLAVARRAHG